MINYEYVKIKDKDIVEGATFYAYNEPHDFIDEDDPAEVLFIKGDEAWISDYGIVTITMIKDNYRKRVENPVKKLYAWRNKKGEIVFDSTNAVIWGEHDRCSEFDIDYSKLGGE